MTAKDERDRGRTGLPPKMAETTPPVYPSGDYTYVLEIVMGMQATMGKLTEAVESLKSQSKDQGDKIDKMGKDIHGAKVGMGVVAVAAGVLSWFIHEIIPYLSLLHSK